MAGLQNLRPSLLTLPYEAKVKLHRDVRQRRRTFSPTNRVVKAEVKKVDRKGDRLLNSMSNDELMNILKKLGV